MVGARHRAVDLVRGKRHSAKRRRRQLAEAVEGLERRQRAGRGGGASRGTSFALRLFAPLERDLARTERDRPAQHLDEQTGERQIRPVGIRRDVEKHDKALTLFRRCDERRAVGKARPDLGLACHARIGEHLAVDLDIIGHGEAAEGTVVLERRKRLRRAPGERAAERAAAAPERYGEQFVAALLKPRAGETNEHAARLDPGFELFLGAGDELADIGENDGRDLLRDQVVNGVGDVALARRHHVGVRRKRALDVIEGRKQRLRRFARLARDDADAMPLRAGIEQVNRARGTFARDRDARDLIADLDRQIELHRGFAAALVEGKGRLAERLAAAGQRLDDARRAVLRRRSRRARQTRRSRRRPVRARAPRRPVPAGARKGCRRRSRAWQERRRRLGRRRSRDRRRATAR